MKNEKPHFDLRDAGGLTPEQLADKLFFDKYVVIGNVSHWKEQHKAEYAAAKKASSRVDPSQRERLKAQLQSLQPKPRRVDADELEARGMFSEDAAKEIFANQKPGHADNLKAMEKTAPMRAYWVRTALWSYGLLSARPTKPAPKAETRNEFPLSDELAARYNMPKGVLVTLDELADLAVKHSTKPQATDEQKEQTPPTQETGERVRTQNEPGVLTPAFQK